MSKGAKKELPIDQKLISYYGSKTPTEIEELTGIPAAEVMKRTQEILGERDYLGEDAKVQVVISRLDAISAEIERRMPSFSDRNIAAAANAAAGSLGRVLAEMRKIREESKVDLEAITNRQARELVSIVESAMQRSIGSLKARYPEIDAAALEAELQGHIMDIAREYDD
jgi:hypothetical protein